LCSLRNVLKSHAREALAEPLPNVWLSEMLLICASGDLIGMMPQDLTQFFSSAQFRMNAPPCFASAWTVPQFPVRRAHTLSRPTTGVPARSERGGGATIHFDGRIAAEECIISGHDESTPADSLDARWHLLLGARTRQGARGISANGKAETFEALVAVSRGGDNRNFISGCCAANGIGDERGPKHIFIGCASNSPAPYTGVMQTVSAPHEVETELRQLPRRFCAAWPAAGI